MDMTIKIITVGNKPTQELSSLITNYTKRFPHTISVTWQYLKHASSSDVITSKQQESETILRAIQPNQFVILLDETGIQITSGELSKKLFGNSKNLTFIIGGAYGVNDEVKNRADFVWSLSKLVLPHQLVRLVLSEQIYRAFTINTNHPYHHS
jgi:23S rRNA (pseudouridine1915-N3)-methyltransferase